MILQTWSGHTRTWTQRRFNVTCAVTESLNSFCWRLERTNWNNTSSISIWWSWSCSTKQQQKFKRGRVSSWSNSRDKKLRNLTRAKARRKRQRGNKSIAIRSPQIRWKLPQAWMVLRRKSVLAGAHSKCSKELLSRTAGRSNTHNHHSYLPVVLAKQRAPTVTQLERVSLGRQQTATSSSRIHSNWMMVE